VYPWEVDNRAGRTGFAQTQAAIADLSYSDNVAIQKNLFLPLNTKN